MLDEVERTQALENLIRTTITALGEEAAKPLEIEAYFECVEFEYSTDELCPRVRVKKG